MFGAGLDATAIRRQSELLKAAQGKVETVFDTRARELATAGGIQNESIRSLAWAGNGLPHTPALLSGTFGAQMIEQIADSVAAHGFSAVQAPGHLLRERDSPWLDVDIALTRRLRRKLDSRRFIGAFVSRQQALVVLAKPGLRSALGCRDTPCCRRGPVDTDLDPRRHFILQRDGEVHAISRRPEPVRAGASLEDFLRPATELAMRATRAEASLASIQERLDGWRRTLGALNKQGPPDSFSAVPEGKRIDSRLRRNA